MTIHFAPFFSTTSWDHLHLNSNPLTGMSPCIKLGIPCQKYTNQTVCVAQILQNSLEFFLTLQRLLGLSRLCIPPSELEVLGFLCDSGGGGGLVYTWRGRLQSLLLILTVITVPAFSGHLKTFKVV